MIGKRIVSLIPSATEIVSALGFDDQLVGRSHECDYPPSVNALPICTEPKLDSTGTSREIDDQVRTILQKALAVYRVNEYLLKILAPDIIVTQSQCDVCAVSLKDVEVAICEWVESRPRLVSLEPNSLQDVWEDIRRVAHVLEAPEQASSLIRMMKSRITEIYQKAQSLGKKPAVACIEWIDPIMAAGNWMPDLVSLAGGFNLFGRSGKHSSWITWEEIRKKDPEIIAVMPCGFGLKRTRCEMNSLADQEGWKELRAVRMGRVYLTDGNQYFNRPGPRLVESLEILAEILHPGKFEFGHQGTGWEPL